MRINKTRYGQDQLTVTIAKKWLKIEETQVEDDDLIRSLITEAREILENYLNVSFVQTSISAITSETYLELPYSPINQIDNVQAYPSGTSMEYTWDGEYINFINTNIGTSVYSTGTYLINYDAGFSSLPIVFELAWKQTLSFLYENRGDIKIGDYLKFNIGINNLRKKVWI